MFVFLIDDMAIDMIESNNMIKSLKETVQLPEIYIKRKSFYIMKVIYNYTIKPSIYKKCKKCTTIFIYGGK